MPEPTCICNPYAEIGAPRLPYCPACNPHTSPQPAPRASIHPAVWDLVIADMRARDQFGLEKYKTRLRSHNGRDALADAFQEALDLCAYIRQAIYERDGK